MQKVSGSVKSNREQPIELVERPKKSTKRKSEKDRSGRMKKRSRERMVRTPLKMRRQNPSARWRSFENSSRGKKNALPKQRLRHPRIR